METNNRINRKVVRLYDVFDGNTGIKLNNRPIRVASGLTLNFLNDIGIDHCYALEVGTTQKTHKHNSVYYYEWGDCVYRGKGQHYC